MTTCILSLDPGPRHPDADSFDGDRCAQCGAAIADNEGRGSTTQGPFTSDDVICGGCMYEFAAASAPPEGDDSEPDPDTMAMLESLYDAPVTFEKSIAEVRGLYVVGDKFTVVHLNDGRWQPHIHAKGSPCLGEFDELVDACDAIRRGARR